MKSEQFPPCETVCLYQRMRNKADLNWNGPVIVIGRFGIKGDLVYIRGNSVEIDIDDLRTSNMIFEVLGCDGALRLHLAKTKLPIRYLADPQTLVFLAQIRNDIFTK